MKDLIRTMKKAFLFGFIIGRYGVLYKDVNTVNTCKANELEAKIAFRELLEDISS